jgi:NADPH:quinone reductase-like Zn-dependent oxidoreductase
MSSTQQARQSSSARDATMGAAVFHRYGGPEVVQLERVSKPAPAAGEVLVRLAAADVSIADHRARALDFPPGFGLFGRAIFGFFRPRRGVLGIDGVGVIEAVGAGVTAWHAGDEVMIVRGFVGGCHAEFATVAADGAIAHKPANLSFEQAAALPFGGYTAMAFLDLVELGPSTKVLVNGGSSAVGSIAVQLAARAGAQVTAVCSGPNVQLVRSLGAQRVIDYAAEDFASGTAGYDVIVECVGNAPFSRVEPVLSRGGALLQIVASLGGMLSGGRQGKKIGGMVTARGAKLSNRVALERLRVLAEAGELTPVIDSTYDLADIVEAHRRVDTGRKRGNVIVRIS